MLARNILLALGVLAVLSGVLLGVVWYRQPAAVSVVRVVPQVAILVAARLIPTGTLLRPEDMTWRDIPQPEIVPANIVRGPTTVADLVGAVARRTFQTHDALVATEFVKPGERDFLVATLAPGFRAVSISVDATQSASGLMMPGDRVDVLLTQNFAIAPDGDPGMRAVGETVLHDLRIIAMDQTLSDSPRPASASVVAGAELHLPKTITLEVSERQAEILLVANQLGKVQLSLRGQRAVPGGPAVHEDVPPTWASDVSPALDRMGAAPPTLPAAPSTAATAAPARDKAPVSIQVIRGSKIEKLCVTATGIAACS
jgi:pilus assembly protein CpaB